MSSGARIEDIARAKSPTIIVLNGDGYNDAARQWLLAEHGRRNLVCVRPERHEPDAGAGEDTT